MDITNITAFAIQKGILWLPKIAAVIFIILLFFVLAKVVQRIIIKFSKGLNFDPHLTHFFAQVSRVIFTLLGIITALGTIGVNISAIVAGLGLTGFALGFAFKDTISNLLSGILILLYRPFNVHDRIKVAGYKGEVLSVDLRYTKLETEDGIVLIPNSKCFTDPVVVYSAN